MSVERIKDLPADWGRGDACLVKAGEQHYVVSSAVVPFSGFETLVFASDAEGTPESWSQVAGGRGMSREEAIEDLEAQLETA